LWVKLRAPKHIDIEGVQRSYHPGDWVNVGRQSAMAWLNDHTAELPSLASRQQLDMDFSGCRAVLALGDKDTARRVADLLPRLRVCHNMEEAEGYERLVLAKPSATTRVDLWPAGFDWLTTWEVLAPLMADYKTAADLGVGGERTLAVIGDLRVPAYDDRLVFLRRGQAAEDLLSLWREEEQYGPALALTRALYRAKPLLLALPPTWLSAEQQGKYRRGA
jgi:hypothetical protein